MPDARGPRGRAVADPESAADPGVRTVRNDFGGQAQQVLQVGTVETLNVHQMPPVPSRPNVPMRNIPPSVGMFFNHASLLLRVGARTPDSQPQLQNPRILVLWGRRGVGKSALLRRIAAQWGDRFPGGHLYFDYGTAHQRGGAVIEDVLVRILRRLNVEEVFMPTDLDGLIDLYRSLVAELPGPVLVAVDDVRTAEQVRALVPNAAGCLVVVTADTRLSALLMDGAELMEVERLDSVAGLALLGSLSGREFVDQERGAATELVELCDGLPLALGVAGARLQAETCLSVQDLVIELGDVNRRMGGLALDGEPVVAAVLDTSYRDLPEAARVMYRRLGQLPFARFSLEVAAVVAAAGSEAAVDPAATAAILSVLVQRRFLERLDSGWFEMHGLIRAHARYPAEVHDGLDPADGTDSGVVLRVVVNHYRSVADAADRLIIPDRLRSVPDPAATPSGDDGQILVDGETTAPAAPGSNGPGSLPFTPDQAAALDWLEREYVNLAAVQRAAAERGWHAPVWQLAESVSALFLHRRHLPTWYATGTLGATSAEVDGRPDAAARLWSLTSRPMADLGKFDEARTASLRALELARTAVNSSRDLRRSRELLASVWEFRGRVLDRDDPPAAVEAYRRSLQLNQQADQVRGAALATFFLGRALDATGDHDAAISSLTAALAEFDVTTDRRMRARVQAALGVAQAHRGDLDTAAAALSAAITEFADLDTWSYQAQALDDLAAVEHLRGAEGNATALRDRAQLIRERRGGASSPA